MTINYYCIHKPHEQSKTSFDAPKIESERIKLEERLGMTLKKTHRVFLKHFKDTDVISKWKSGKGIKKYSALMISPNFNKATLETTLITSPELKRRKLDLVKYIEVMTLAVSSYEGPGNPGHLVIKLKRVTILS
ncbi:Hypothetical protein CINCED_3A019627 [Cinara cedri]|uniref:Uncharacterized protein n=1 Tax=Cinara cedri TaxID=506608 RepID=A0A5E4MUW0_9HEMI|nr:Hypothetical protein CINCED_3A019627 [Cinara cedri]